MNEPTNATVMPVFDKKDIDDNRLVACLSYIGILFIIPLLAKRDSKYCQEHAKQGLVLFIVWIVGSLIFWVPFFGWAAAIVVFLANLYVLLKCFNGEFWEIPAVGGLRNKFNL